MSTAMLKGGAKGATAVGASEFYDCIQRMLRKTPELAPRFENGKIAIAVSGGPDSLALAHLLRKMYPKERLVGFFVDHDMIKHGITESTEIVKNIFEKLDIEGHVMKIPWLPGEQEKLTKGQMQERLRESRYSLLLEACAKHQARLLLTGHNLDDDISVMIYRMSHASGVEGIAGMKAVTPFPVTSYLAEKYFVGHPLLGIEKERLVKTCEELGFEWNLDKGNENLVYQHNSILDSLVKAQDAGTTDLPALQDALEFFKDYRRDVHREVMSVFKSSVVVNVMNGESTVFLNEDRWLKQTAIFGKVLNLLVQYTAAKSTPSATRRIVSVQRNMVKAYNEYNKAQKALLARIRTPLQESDKARRVDMGQMTLGGATIYPLSQSDTLLRIENAARMTRREIKSGPAFLVQREPPTRVNNQQACFLPTEVELAPGEVCCWDGRVFLRYSDLRNTDGPADDAPLEKKKFIISHMTKADVREFYGLAERDGFKRNALYSFMASTPASHFYHVPVVREFGGSFMAFPTLRASYPPNLYEWSCQYAGNSVLVNRFQCNP